MRVLCPAHVPACVHAHTWKRWREKEREKYLVLPLCCLLQFPKCRGQQWPEHGEDSQTLVGFITELGVRLSEKSGPDPKQPQRSLT